MMQRHLILLHGALADGSQLKSFSERFSDHKSIHVLTFGGHGSVSDLPFGFSIDGFIEEVNQYCDQHLNEPVDLFGYSMGGYVALKLAVKHPEKVRRIVTLGTKLDWNPASAEKEQGMLDPVKIASRFPEYAAGLRKLHSGLGWEQVLERTAELMRLIGADPVTETQFEAIRVPVLLMVGELDKMVTAAETGHVAGLIPGARWIRLPNTPHPFEQVDQELIYSEITKFLQ